MTSLSPPALPPRTVDDAVAAADEIGYPCVVKAQVLIGGRGKAGGIKLANDRHEAEDARQRDPRHGHPRLHGPRGVGRGRERHRRRVLRVDRLRPQRAQAAGDALDAAAAWTSRRSRRPTRRRSRRCTSIRCWASRTSTPGGSPSTRASTPTSCARSARCSRRLYAAFVAEEAMLVEVNPLIVTPDRQVRALDAKVTLDDNSLFRHPDNAALRNPQRRGPAGADGQGARADLRQARRQHRHPRQRRRARHVDARRRRARGRQAGELPRRRRRLEGRRGHERGRGDPRQRVRQRRALQHLRRHHALRRGRARPDRGVRDGEADGALRRPAGRHERRGGARAARRGGAAQRPRGGDDGRGRREGRGAGRHEHPDRQGHEARRLGHHRARGHLPRAEQPALRHPGRRRRHAGQGRPGRRGHPRLQHVRGRRRGTRARTRR